MDPFIAAVRFPFRWARQWRRLRFWLGLGLCLLGFYPSTLLAQTQPQSLPPPPVVEPALDTPGGAALLLDGAIPMSETSLEAAASPVAADEPLTLEAETRTDTVVGREIILEPEETRNLAAPPDSGNPIVVPIVLMERTSGRRIIISPGQEIRIEDPSQEADPEPASQPQVAAGDERLLYPLPRPVPITSGFGMRMHPIRGQPEFHAGVDLGASMGTPILASFSGRVVNAGSLGGLGIAVVLEHAGNQRTRYGHMSEVAVAAGEQVQQGSVIGYVGASGEVTGPHLHFELWKRASGQDWVVLDATDDLKIAVAQLPG
ncbi:M23 family metallopeptidase [Synechococcus bigranulatus str. 'Rupite']|uniref:M23 family metallopeptidase n=2 Tax=Thermostichus vulcanus TaxID=32053 RepID=A0ABT0CAP0_THEVL|nr:M23 family metallopeptidase [Thermostichus vulcanus str. 'Rupite']